MAEYIYFCSSLPALRYGHQAPISSQQFLSTASTVLEASDFQQVKALSLGNISSQGLLPQYYGWEIALRNLILQQRLKRVEVRSTEPRSGGDGSASLGPIVEQLFQQVQKIPLKLKRA